MKSEDTRDTAIRNKNGPGTQLLSAAPRQGRVQTTELLLHGPLGCATIPQSRKRLGAFLVASSFQMYVVSAFPPPPKAAARLAVPALGGRLLEGNAGRSEDGVRGVPVDRQELRKRPLSGAE